MATTTKSTKKGSVQKAVAQPAAKKATATKKAVTKKAATKSVAEKAPQKAAAPAKKAGAKAPASKETKAAATKKSAAPKAAAKKASTSKKKPAAKTPTKTVTTFAKTALPSRKSESLNAPKAPASKQATPTSQEEKKSNQVIAHRRMPGRDQKKDDNSRTMINYQPEFTRSILDEPEERTGPVYRYSDEELQEFKELIQSRLETARSELSYLQGLITRKDEAGTEDTENRYMSMEDGSGAMEREQLAQLASRQIQFINHLEKALIRIENKTYGICRVTGQLIDKARLRAVPHATLSIEAKRSLSKS